MTDLEINNIIKRMDGAIESLKKQNAGIRSGRASSSLVEAIKVDAYGQLMEIKDLASVSIPEARVIKISVWDANLVNSMEKALRMSTLDFNPLSEGQVIRINIPELTAERRKEFAKTSKTFSESAKVAIRNIRQDAMNILKRQSQQGEISDDQLKGVSTKVQKLTDGYISKIIDINNKKEAEILQI